MKLLTSRELAVILPLSGLAIIGTAVLFSMPLFIGAAATAFNLNSSQQGVLAAMDIAGASMAGLVSVLWIQRWSWKGIGVLSIAGMVAFNFGSLMVSDFLPLCLMRVLAGFSSGTIWAIHLAAIGSRADPDRAFGASIIIQMAFFAVGTEVAAAAIKLWGFSGIVYYLIGLTAICAPGLLWVSAGTRAVETATHTRDADGHSWRGLASFIALGLYTMGVSAVWAFTERIGHAAGLSLDSVASALSTSFFVSIAGPLIVLWMGASLGLVVPLLAGFVATVLFILLFHEGYLPNYAIQYVIAAWGFQLAWQFLSPLQLAVVTRADVQKRLIAACPLALGVGASLGPPIGGFLIGDGQFHILLGFGAIVVLGSALLVLPAAVSQQRQIKI